MGKTLGSILSIGAAVAVNAIPGIGTVVSGALFTAFGGTAAGIAAGIVTTYALTAGLTLYGVSSAASVLGLGPSLPKPETTETAIKTSRPPRVSATGRSRLYGAYALYETAADGTAADVYAVHDGPAQPEAFYLGDEKVTLSGNTVQEGEDGRYKDAAVRLYWTVGEAVGTAFSALVSLLPGIWTSNHRGDGVVMLALTAKSVKAKDFQETYPQSTVPVPSMVARWGRFPDPAAPDPADPTGWTWTENPVRHLLWYKLVFEGVDYATRIAPTLDRWIAAATHCDEPVALKGGGTEPRYRSCVAFKHTDQRKDVVAAFLSTFDGWIAPRADGALVIYSGRFEEPAPDDWIGPDEIVSYTWDGVGIDDDKAVNEISVSYVSAEHDYNMVEGEAWRDEDDISSRGQVLSAPLEAQVPSFPQARRLAKRKMARIMAQARGTVTTTVAGRKVRGKRYIRLHIEEAGVVFFSGAVEITALTRNMATGGVTFTWVAADPNIDAWSPALEEGEPAPVGERVAPQPLDAPVITSATFASGTLTINATGPARDDLTWFVRTRTEGATLWGPIAEYPDVDPGPAVVLQTDIVPLDKTIEIQVAYQVGDGRQSPWSGTRDETTGGGALVPPTNLSVTGGTGEAEVTFRYPTSPFDYVRVRRGTSPTYSASSFVSGELVGALGAVESFEDTGIAPGNYFWWVTAYGDGDTARVGPFAATVT